MRGVYAGPRRSPLWERKSIARQRVRTPPGLPRAYPVEGGWGEKVPYLGGPRRSPGDGGEACVGGHRVTEARVQEGKSDSVQPLKRKG